MNDHVNKPIDPKELFDALARFIAPQEGQSCASGDRPEAAGQVAEPAAGPLLHARAVGAVLQDAAEVGPIGPDGGQVLGRDQQSPRGRTVSPAGRAVAGLAGAGKNRLAVVVDDRQLGLEGGKGCLPIRGQGLGPVGAGLPGQGMRGG